MELVVDWRNSFVDARSRQDAGSIVRCLRDAPDCFARVQPGQHEDALEVLFQKKDGLFQFARSVTAEEESQRGSLDDAVKELFNVLKTVMELYREDYEPFVMETRDVCFQCIISSQSFAVKRVASESLKKLIKLFRHKEMKLYEIVLFENRVDVLYIVLGAIARYCPETNHISSIADEIFLYLINDLEHQFNQAVNHRLLERIEINLECILDMLMNFLPFRENPESDYFQKLYNYFLTICEDENSEELTFRALKIMSTHMQHFSSFVYRDNSKWHDLLNVLLDKSDNSIIVDALKALYEIVPLHLVEETSEEIFLYFKNYFMTNIYNTQLSTRKLLVIIYGSGQFAIALAKYSQEELLQLFSTLAYQASKFQIIKDCENEDIETVPQYLYSIAEILHHMPTVTLHHLSMIVDLSILIFKIFPELSKRGQDSAIEFLKLTFIRIKQLESNLQQRYFHFVLYEAILYTCGHPLWVDVELLKETRKRPVDCYSYKDFLKLWQAMLNVDNCREEFGQHIFRDLTMVILSFAENLNLGFQPAPNRSYPDSCMIFKAENEADLRYFTNIVDLCCDIYSSININVLMSQAKKLLLYYIKCSYKNYLVSGFYKLIKVIFQRINDANIDCLTYFDEHTCCLVPEYLADVLKFSNENFDDFRSACIYLIFNTPLCFVPKILEPSLPLFTMAFNMGLYDLPLAFSALEALEYWCSSINDPVLEKYRNSAIGLLEPFLYNNKHWFELNANQQLECLADKKKWRNSVVHCNDVTLEAFQNRILLFFCTIDQQTMSDFLYERDSRVQVHWAKKEQLRFELLFPDVHLEFGYDRFIPRILELTRHSERRIKFSACEMFHTMLTIILGKRLFDQCLRKDLLTELIKLASDPDDAVRNLFHPLVLQLTHYLSMRLMIETHRAPLEFLDVLFEGLADEYNPNLRDYCGICLKEFVQWTIKQSNDADTSKHANFTIFIKRIIEYATYPSKNKRIAAATAFNYLYASFSGSISVINIYWLQFLWAFVSCLEQCGDIRIRSVINNIEGVVKVTANPLNAKCKPRVKPPGFQTENLRSAVIWLLGKCGSLSVHCRMRCNDLVESLSPCLPGFKSCKEFLTSYGVDGLNDIALKHLTEDDDKLTILKVKAFLRALDFYVWVFSKKLMTPEDLLEVKDEQCGGYKFFQFFNKFTATIVEKNIPETARMSYTDPKDVEKLCDLINEAIIKFFKFSSILLVNRTDDHKVLDYLWTDNYFTLIYRFALSPRRLGLSAKTIHTCDPPLLESLFNIMMKALPEPFMTKLFDHRFLDNQDECITFAMIEDHCKMVGTELSKSKEEILLLKDFVRGMIILRTCDLLDFGNGNEFTIPYLMHRITVFYETSKIFLTNDVENEVDESYMIEYMRDVLRLFLLKFQAELIETIFTLVFEAEPIANGSSTSHPERFLKAFRGPIFQCMLRNPNESIRIILKLREDTPDIVLNLIADLLCFARYYSTNELGENLANAIINNCDNLFALANYSDSRKQRLFDINRMAIELKSKPSDVLFTGAAPSPFYFWVIDRFRETRDLERTMIIIDNFFSCLIDSSDVPNGDINLVFSNLKGPNPEAWRERLETDPLERNKALKCLQILFRKFFMTRSIIVLEGTIRYVLGACSLLLNKKTIGERLSPFYTCFSESAYTTLEVMFKAFKDRNLRPEERVEVLDYFLLPALETCMSMKTANFFRNFGQEIAGLLSESMSDTERLDRKHTIVSRIGGFKLFGLLYGRIQFGCSGRYGFDYGQVLHEFVLKRCIDIRSFSPQYPEEKELVRQVHCAALNCSIAFSNYQNYGKPYYDVMFNESRAKEQIIWEKIVDHDKVYDMRKEPTKCVKKYVNIFEKVDTRPAAVETAFAAFYRRIDPSTQGYYAVQEDEERRKSIELEDDELNNHECTASISAAIMHYFNMFLGRLPPTGESLNESDLPVWMIHLREGFHTGRDNVTLLLLRVISNVKKAFVPFIRNMFESIVFALLMFLKTNPLNYLVRDVLTILSDMEYELRLEAEKDMAQELVECLIEKLKDPNPDIFSLNVATIEGLINAWSSDLKLPKNLLTVIDTEPDLAIRVVLLLFRHNIDQRMMAIKEMHAMVRKSMFRWQEPIAPYTFEILGWILKLIGDQQRTALIRNDLIDLFEKIQRHDPNMCARYLYVVYLAYPALAKQPAIHQFLNPMLCSVDERKRECLEVVGEAIGSMNADEILGLLAMSNVKNLLRDKVLACIDSGFRIVEKLINVLSAQQLLEYAAIIEMYTNKTALLEHKNGAYVIFMNIYEKFLSNSQVPNCDRATLDLVSTCKRVLINGVSDPSDEIQEEVMAFWRERAFLSTSLTNRIRQLICLYSVDVSSSFAQFVCLLMLDLTSRSTGNQKVLFTLLAQSAFLEEYELVIATARKRRPPLFGSSLTAIASRAIALQGSKVRKGKLDLRTFEQDGAAVINVDLYERLTRPNAGTLVKIIPEPSENKLSKRYSINNGEKYAASHSKEEYYQKLFAESQAQRETVKVNRRYRLMGYPDVEITQSAVVACLEDIVLKDRQFASDFMITLLVATIKCDDAGLIELVEEMCTKALSVKNDFAPTVMKIIYEVPDIRFTVADLTRTAIATGTERLAIMLLERTVLGTKDQPYSRPKINENNQVYDRYHMCSLYRSIGDNDMPLNLARNWSNVMVDTENWLNGCIAESRQNWMEAKVAYEAALSREREPAADYCREGLFKCLNELSSWREINDKVKSTLNNNYDTVWASRRRDELLPWMIKSQLQIILESIGIGHEPDKSFIGLIDKWMSSHSSTLLKSFGEEIAAFEICNSNNAVRHYLRTALNDARGSWVHSGSEMILDKIRNIKDTDAYLRAVKEDDVRESSKELIKFWNQNLPRCHEKLTWWVSRVNRRVAYATFMIEKVKDQLEYSDVLADIVTSMLYQRVQISFNSVQNSNKYIGRKHNFQIEKALSHLNIDDNPGLLDIHHNLNLAISLLKAVSARGETVPKNKFIYYAESWRLANEILCNNNISPMIKLKAKHHSYDVMSKLHSLALEEEAYADFMVGNEFTKVALDVEDAASVRDALLRSREDMLRNLCIEGSNEDLISGYEKYIEYCYKLFKSKTEPDLEIQIKFVKLVLKGMELGSQRAVKVFPCLLLESFYKRNQDSLKEVFMKESQSIPCWVFLSWKEQIVTLLKTSLQGMILPIFLRLATEYPSAMAYELRALIKVNPEVCENLAINEICLKILDVELKTFLRLIESLCEPEKYLIRHLKEILNLSQTDERLVQEFSNLFDEMFTSSEADNFPASYRKMFNEFRCDLEKLKYIRNRTAATELVNRICSNLHTATLGHPTIPTTKETFELIGVEIPGQYEPYVKPVDSQYRIKVAGIRGALVITNKVCHHENSIVTLKLLGTNGMTYRFRVKYEPDIRVPQRIQRIFRSINDILKDDKICRSKRLRLQTENIIPLSKSVGLVSEVSGSRSLSEYVKFSTSDEVINIMVNMYQQWIEAAGGPRNETRKASWHYRQAIMRYNKSEVTEKMKVICRKLDPFALRQTYIEISNSSEHFFKIRHNFIQSYAVTCLAHWLLGIAERNINNLLLNENTGVCTSIEHSLVFGQGFETPIPELLAFRLTPQIYCLMRPYRDKDSFKLNMIDSLKALLKEQDIFLASTNVIMHEGLNWNEKLNNYWAADGVIKYLKWSPKKKCAILFKKLNGAKPGNIIVEEVISVQNPNEDTNLIEFYKNIICGTETPSLNVKSNGTNDYLSPEDQVQSLLDQSSDLNILGRMWVGWYPMV
ncbi:hypothetical protein TKK_0012714 [Trichogramma kaykai]|uniref:Non-specific serine/threonine protein kinase n=1 Tax=Trichogramma kaykai TaxID=54128 RepID=A0ABD2WLB6_9HYME